MDPERLKKLASEGGKEAHRKGTAHRFEPEEARIAGAKGGLKVSVDIEHMKRIGRLGGHATAALKRARKK